MKILHILTRLYLEREQLAESIAFYEAQFSTQCSLRESYSHIGVEAAQIGPLLLLAGSQQALEPFKDAKANFLVDSLADWQEFLMHHDATLLEEPKQAATGWEMRVRHPDGNCVKYIEYTGSVYQESTPAQKA